MILLHLILSNVPHLPDDEMITDIEKSLDIFASMNNVHVARRCAEMIREVLDVARTCLARRRCQTAPTTTSTTTTAGGGGGTGMDPPDAAAQSSPVSPFDTGFGGIEGDFISLFSGQDSAVDAGGSGEGGGSTTSTRAGVLANLVDPMILEDFAFGGTTGSDYSIFWGG